MHRFTSPPKDVEEFLIKEVKKGGCNNGRFSSV